MECGEGEFTSGNAQFSFVLIMAQMRKNMSHIWLEVGDTLMADFYLVTSDFEL
jgi:hypothetical protein